MNEYLSNYSIVSLYSLIDNQRSFIAAQSLIKNKMFLNSDQNYHSFENTLFLFETEGNTMDFSTHIQYEQSVYIRHKVSRKYLAVSVDEEEEKEIRYKIVLGSEKYHFKIAPCYQYQTKISTKIKFDEEIYLKTQFASTREGMVLVQGGELLLGFNQGSKLQLHLYSLFEKEEKCQRHGSVVWLSHIQSGNFLSVAPVNGKEEVVFQPIHYDKQIQNLKALWTIHSNNLTASSHIKFDEELRLKNLYNGQFLTFSRNYRLVDNQRIYQIYLEEAGSDFSKFIFRPIKEMDRREIGVGAYMSLLHAESGLFLGCRRERVGEYYKLLTFPLMDDEDLFRVNKFGPEEEQALRLIFVVRQEFKNIAAAISTAQNGLNTSQMRDVHQTYTNVFHELTALRSLNKLYQFVRNELGSSIKFIADNLIYFRQEKNNNAASERVKRLSVLTIKLSYKILQLFCVEHDVNQRICYSFSRNFLGEIGSGLGAEQLLIETFRDCRELLPLIHQSPTPNYPNLIRALLQEFEKKNTNHLTIIYWTRLLQFVELLNVLMFYRGNPLDINQYLISQELFGVGFYTKVFPPLRVQGERVLVQTGNQGEYQEIEKVGDERVALGIEAIFGLFTNLTSSHSIPSKTHIHNYLARHNQACLTTFIGYLNRPLRKQLYSTLLNFIANCYIDSAPRLRRQKPLSFLFFSFEQQLTNVEAQQAYYSERLRQMFMLKAQQSRVCKPLHYSNIISIGNLNEPSISEQQLVIFRLNLTETILNSNSCSKEQLETVELLMRLDCYTVNQMLQLYEDFKLKLTTAQVKRDLIPKLLSFFQQILLIGQELDIKKLKIYLQHKFQLNQDVTEQEYKYVLPLGPRAPISFTQSQKPNQTQNPAPVNEPDATHRSMISKNYLADFNELRDTLQFMHASQELQNSLMQYFCGEMAGEDTNGQYLSSVFSLLVRSHLPKYEFLRLLTRCTILTHQQVDQFDRLFDLSKKLQYLVLVSENWLVRDDNVECGRLFLNILGELTDYLFDGRRSGQTLQVKRQLFIGNLGVHRSVFQLLEKSVYLLKVTKKELKKKHKESFEACFDFVYWVIRQCSENKRVIYEYFSILLPYQRCQEVGQTRVFTEFYRDEKDFAKQINFSVIESLVERIIHHPTSTRKYEECEYNPDYINILIVLIESLDIENKFFIQKLYKLIIHPDIFHRLLFLEQPKEKQRPKLGLKLHRLRLDPIQVPVIYHLRLLRLFRLIFQNCSQVIRNSLKLKLSQVLEVEYLLQFLAEPDIFSNLGINPQLNFLLKEEVIHFLLILLQKTDAHTQLYESDALTTLIQFYARIFLQKGQRKEITSESESLFLPYLQAYGDYIAHYQQNRSIYYIEHVNPLIQKLVAIFERQPLRSGSNRLRQRLFTVAEALKESAAGITIKRATTQGQMGLKEVKMKWRNFVDDDEDNSKQQKYAKKVLLDILKSKPAKEQIQNQFKKFYSAIGKRSKQFVASTLKLLTMLFASKDISDGRKKQGKIAQEALKYFSGYIQYCGEKQSLVIVEQLQKQDFIEVLLRLTSQKEFQLSRMHLKNIFALCLRILNFQLARDNVFKTHKLLLGRFGDRQYGNKFLEFLKEGALEVISSTDSQHYYQQINSALKSMRLSADEPAVRIFQESFLTLTLLCKHDPFTDYLRAQQSQFGDIDFLDKIYNMLTFLFTNKNFATHISISYVRAAEYILDFVSSMLTGRNTTNQNYIIDNKYANFVHEVLKLEKLEPPKSQPIRQELLKRIVEFYHSNGIDIGDLLHSKIKLIDFRQDYLLNRFKYIVVKTLLQCLIGNSATETKVKLQLPVSIIKLNLIWVYELYKKYGLKYIQSFIVHGRDDWPALVQGLEEKDRKEDIEEPVQRDKSNNMAKDLYLRLGFFYYQIIQIFQQQAQGEGEMSHGEQRQLSEQKQKERIVRRFFLSIRQGQRRAQSEQLLMKEQMSDQMRYYYHIYYNALQFFGQKTSTIQVNLKGQILRVYFPKVPLAEAITAEMREQFENKAVRISRDEKIKSLLEWQQNFFEDIKGQDDFFGEIQKSMPTVGPWLQLIKYQNQFLFFGWLISVIICMVNLIKNYQQPSFDFSGEFFKHITVSVQYPIHNLMLLLCIANLLIGILIGLYLFTRKIPLRKRLLQLKFNKLKAQGQNLNRLTFIYGQIFRQSIYNIYMVIFLSLTIVHPFFSAFPLVDAINRIAMGRFIIRSIIQTWSQLLVTVGLLMVFNVLYVQLAYQFFTTAPVYGQICKYMLRCTYMFNDQNLKAGQGVFGVAQSDYTNMVLDFQVIYEIMYIILSLKVIFEIFSGTIIDKFSELREQEEAIEDDKNKVCFICAMERFDLDLDYQGFEQHTKVNHNCFHYIEYLFYLRRCQPQQYGIIQRFITDCKQKESQQWIPQLDSLYKQKKREQEQENKLDAKERLMQFCKEKICQVKKMHQKVEIMMKDLGKDVKDDRQNKQPNQKNNQ